jgi:hypothetical protein
MDLVAVAVPGSAQLIGAERPHESDNFDSSCWHTLFYEGACHFSLED